MKVYWAGFPHRPICSYQKGEHSDSAYKFLYWAEEEGILLVGSEFFENHKILHKKASDCVPSDKPDGAGTIYSGKVGYWNSIGYEFETPEEYKIDILNALGMENSSSN